MDYNVKGVYELPTQADKKKKVRVPGMHLSTYSYNSFLTLRKEHTLTPVEPKVDLANIIQQYGVDFQEEKYLYFTFATNYGGLHEVYYVRVLKKEIPE